MPTLSVITPVYNIGDYIKKYLSSVESQTFSDYELILVDDHSTDKTLAIIYEYLSASPIKKKTKVIESEKNQGPGLAKDLGYQNCDPSADYVLFIDSDDSFDSTFFEKLILRAKQSNADITCCGYRRVKASDGALICEEMIRNPETTLSIAETDFPLLFVNTSVWNKLFKKEIANKCQFGNVKYAEDLYFLLQAYHIAETITFVNEPLYSYIVRSGSESNTMSYERYKDVLAHFTDFTAFGNEHPYFELISSLVLIRIGLGMTIRVCESGDKKSRDIAKVARNYLKANFNVFDKNSYLSFRLLRKFGKKGIGVWLLKVLYKIKMGGLPISLYIKFVKRSNKEIRW